MSGGLGEDQLEDNEMILEEERLNLIKELNNGITLLKKLSFANQYKIVTGFCESVSYYEKKENLNVNKKYCEQNGHDYKGVLWKESKYIDLGELISYFSKRLFYSYNSEIVEELDSKFEYISPDRYEILKDKQSYSDGKFYQEINLKKGKKEFSQFIDLEKTGDIYWAQYETCWVRNCKCCNAEEISYTEPLEVKEARKRLEKKERQKQYRKKIYF